MAAGPAQKPVNRAAPSPPSAQSAKSPIAPPANDNRPHWLRWIGGAILLIGLALALYMMLR